MKRNPADTAFHLSFVSPKRVIHTNDFQLSILKRGLAALAHEIAADVLTEAERMTPAQEYELKMLQDMIDDVLKSPPDEKMIHGFIL